MLNRKLNNYLFYGVLALIAISLFGLRVLLVGNLQGSIDNLDSDNIDLQNRIDVLEEIVQENKEVQTSHLYELYDIIPNVYSDTALVYKTVSILESVGVTEANDMQRTVYVDGTVEFPSDSEFFEIAQNYFFVEIQVAFTTLDPEVVNAFIDELYNSNQLFIIKNLEYSVPTDSDYVIVSINFYAIYNILTDVDFDVEEDVNENTEDEE